MVYALPQQQAELEMLERPALEESKAMEYHFPGTAGLARRTSARGIPAELLPQHRKKGVTLCLTSCI